MADAARAAGTYPREVRRIRQRFLAAGLVEALGEDARPKPARLLDARQELRRPIDVGQAAATNDNDEFTRTAQNEIYSQFKRLPNPDLVMYVFPHLAGSDPAPVPGYTTVFPLYQRVQYAMPGERTEEY